MSQFSGKCDFYDTFIEIAFKGDENQIEENIKRLKLHIYGADDRVHRIQVDTIKDLVKYYPYISATHTGSKEGDIYYELSSDSFIDEEEAESKEWKINDLMKYWHKCKRKKIPFTVDGCMKEFKWWYDKEGLRKMAELIVADGDKANFDNVHFSLWEGYRKKWFEEMVRVGYTEREAFCWVYKCIFPTPAQVVERLGRTLQEG